MVRTGTLRTLLLLVASGLTFAGCASVEERHIFDEWTRLNEQTYHRDWEHEAHSGRRHNNTKSKSSAPEFGEAPTLEHYQAYAALHNPRLEASFNRWKAELERIRRKKR